MLTARASAAGAPASNATSSRASAGASGRAPASVMARPPSSWLVMFVTDLTHQLLQEVLHRHHALQPSVVHHNRQLAARP